MPRQPRYFLPNIPQHVIKRGVDRQPAFFQPRDYELYLAVLAQSAVDYDCQIHAYVLMTNHVHLLVTPDTNRSLPLLMQAMGRKYVQRINRIYDRTGTLWQGRYKASLVQSDRYLLTCYRYIELNPVRAGMSVLPGDYPYSSYRHNALGLEDPLVTGHPVYTALGREASHRQLNYRKLFTDHLDETLLARIRATTNACLVLGDDPFKDRIERMLGRAVRPGRKGRPRK